MLPDHWQTSPAGDVDGDRYDDLFTASLDGLQVFYGSLGGPFPRALRVARRSALAAPATSTATARQPAGRRSLLHRRAGVGRASVSTTARLRSFHRSRSDVPGRARQPAVTRGRSSCPWSTSTAMVDGMADHERGLSGLPPPVDRSTSGFTGLTSGTGCHCSLDFRHGARSTCSLLPAA